jgi:hypothetical protein
VELEFELGFALAKQVLNHLSYTAVHFDQVTLEMGSVELFAWAGLELLSSQVASLPSS